MGLPDRREDVVTAGLGNEAEFSTHWVLKPTRYTRGNAACAAVFLNQMKCLGWEFKFQSFQPLDDI